MDSKKLIIFVVISLALMLGWEQMMNHFYPERMQQATQPSASTTDVTSAVNSAAVPSAVHAGVNAVPALTAREAVRPATSDTR